MLGRIDGETGGKITQGGKDQYMSEYKQSSGRGDRSGKGNMFHKYDHSFPLRSKAQKGYEIRVRNAAFKISC